MNLQYILWVQFFAVWESGESDSVLWRYRVEIYTALLLKVGSSLPLNTITVNLSRVSYSPFKE
jgi:hypothetical protein